MLTIDWAGQEWELLAEKSVHWPSQRALIVADVHFGKAAAFRHLGVPVPRGSTAHDLARLTAIIQRTRCEHLIILGDFLHAKHGREPHTMRLIAEWRAAHASLPISLVRGNHDVHAGDPPEQWMIECADRLKIDGIILQHEPDGTACPSGPVAPVIAGHVHPCVRLRDVDGSSMRCACFVFTGAGPRRRAAALLPAFGSFTGSARVRPREGDRVFAVGEGVGEVIEVEGVCA